MHCKSRALTCLQHNHAYVYCTLQVIVTGATRGLGLRTATHMAEMQAKTILAVRDTEKGAATKQGIIDELQKKGVTVDPSNIEVTRRSEINPIFQVT
jgi:NAD(P)-dependent dehydrogenase (short-subunit alcohol dehydrogenase family)